MQKSKTAVWGGLTIAVKRREVKSKGEKRRYNNYKNIYTQHRNTAIYKANANKYERGN